MKRTSLFTAVLAAAACSADEPGRIPTSEAATGLTLAAVTRAPGVESYPAQVVSDRTAEIATRTSGMVESVLVDVGDRVRSGSVLVLLDGAGVQAQVAAARAAHELALKSFGRIEALHRDGAASHQELDQARARMVAAESALRGARAQESYVTVRAPFDGVVTRRDVDAGDLATPGRPLLTLEVPGALEVVAELPARRTGDLTIGDDVSVWWRDGAEPLTARVSRVVPALGSGSRRFRVEATLSAVAPGLLSGAYARLEVLRPGRGPRWIPSDAVLRRGQLTGIFAVESDTLRLRWVRLGEQRAGAVELLAGPAGVQSVVRRPSSDLYDGRSVADATEEPWSVGGSRGPEVGP